MTLGSQTPGQLGALARVDRSILPAFSRRRGRARRRGSGTSLRRPFGRRRPRERSPRSRASSGTRGRLRGRRSSPEQSSGRRPELGFERERAAGHGRSCGRRRWTSGRLLSAVAGAGTGCGGSGHDGEGLRRRWLRPWWGTGLRRGNEGKKVGETGRSSRQSRRAAQWGRGRPGDGESTAADGGARGGTRWRWWLLGALRLAWLGEEVEGVAAELGGSTEGRGDGGERVGDELRRRQCFG